MREYVATKYLHSGLKSADAQSSSSQVLTATRVYDAFGNVDSSSGSWTGALGYGGPYGYQSASEGGLMLLGHRHYDPSTGRFLTRDPIKDGRNWYAYCDSNPVSRVDVSGLDWHDPVRVSVDPRFPGVVFIIGERGKGQPQQIGKLHPGRMSPIGMDVDLVIVQFPGGRQKRYFLPGIGSQLDLGDYECEYVIGKDGTIVGPEGPSFIVGPRQFPAKGPAPYPWPWQGDWGVDIERAKVRPWIF